MPLRLTIGPIIMDRMIIARQQLEGGEVSLAQRSRRTWETLAHLKLIKPTMWCERTRSRIEGLVHSPPSLRLHMSEQRLAPPRRHKGCPSSAACSASRQPPCPDFFPSCRDSGP